MIADRNSTGMVLAFVAAPERIDLRNGAVRSLALSPTSQWPKFFCKSATSASRKETLSKRLDGVRMELPLMEDVVNSPYQATTHSGRPDLKGDARRVFDVVKKGGIAIYPNTVGYGMWGATPEALQLCFSTKQRGGHKRHAMGCDVQLQRELHVLEPHKQDMIECITQDYDLPLGVVAPYRQEHPLLQKVDPNLLKASTAKATLGLLLNAGPIHSEVGRMSREEGLPLFGSSANLTGTGTKYRAEDIQPEILAIADLVIDYGLCKYHAYRRSATGIDFTTMQVIRIGTCYELISDILKRRFGIDLPADPGREVLPSGHLDEFALKDDD